MNVLRMKARRSHADQSSTPLPWPHNIGKRGRCHGIDGTMHHFEIVDEVAHEQKPVEKGTRKVIYIQRLKFDDGRDEYRFTYYMLGLKQGAKGRWVFGQYSLLIPVRDLRCLLREARKKMWEGFEMFDGSRG